MSDRTPAQTMKHYSIANAARRHATLCGKLPDADTAVYLDIAMPFRSALVTCPKCQQIFAERWERKL